jgi:hypothetical protein
MRRRRSQADKTKQNSKPVEFFTSHRPFLGSTENFFERVGGFFAANGEKDASGDDCGLRVSIDVYTLALVPLSLFSLKRILRVSVFDHLIVYDSLSLVNFFVVRFRKKDDGHGQAEVAALLFDDGEALGDGR